MSLLICTGYVKGELLPDGPMDPVRQRILDYVESFPLEKILIRDAFEIRPFLPLKSDVEIVGAWYTACVFRAAEICVTSGILVRINPALTLGPADYVFDIPTAAKRQWLSDSFRACDFEVKEDESGVLTVNYRNSHV